MRNDLKTWLGGFFGISEYPCFKPFLYQFFQVGKCCNLTKMVKSCFNSPRWMFEKSHLSPCFSVSVAGPRAMVKMEGSSSSRVVQIGRNVRRSWQSESVHRRVKVVAGSFVVFFVFISYFIATEQDLSFIFIYLGTNRKLTRNEFAIIYLSSFIFHPLSFILLLLQ